MGEGREREKGGRETIKHIIFFCQLFLSSGVGFQGAAAAETTAPHVH